MRRIAARQLTSVFTSGSMDASLMDKPHGLAELCRHEVASEQSPIKRSRTKRLVKMSQISSPSKVKQVNPSGPASTLTSQRQSIRAMDFEVSLDASPRRCTCPSPWPGGGTAPRRCCLH